jgi:hypothetical protein
METRPLPDLNYLKECFELDPASPSYLKWNKNRPEHHFKSEKRYKIWKSHCAGKNITNLSHGRYYTVYLRIPRQILLVHRVVYAIYNNTTDFLDKVIDHIDGDCLNNNPENLRACSQGQNQLNSKLANNSKTGHKNIQLINNKYCVCFEKNRKKIYLGIFNSLEEAVEFKNNNIQQYRGEFYKK